VIARALVLSCCLLATGVFLNRAERLDATPVRQPLSYLPLQLGAFQGRVEPALRDEVIRELGADDYIVRSYTSAAHDQAVLGLYVGYHASQRQGDSIHSPLNCLPGAGWIPIKQERIRLMVSPAPGASPTEIEVNRVLIERGLDRTVVLYWYQSHGRIVASEYWGKVFTVVDAVRLGRTDAALVRISSLVPDRTGEAADRAGNVAREFVEALFPFLGRHLPA